MRPDLSKLMQQAQAMERKMQAAQEEMAKQEWVGEAGAGLVKITLSGEHAAKKTELDDNIVPGLSADDKEMLQDLITAAINNANKKVKEASKSTMPDLSGGFDLAGLSKLFKGT